MKILKLIIVILVVNLKLSAQDVVYYEPPIDAIAAPDFEVEVNGKKVFVYNTKSAAIAYFSFQEEANIKVRFLSPVSEVNIRPKNLGIQGNVYRNEVHFSITEPFNLSVEINKNIKRPLFIFANPMETDIPDRSNKNVLYYEGGKIHTPGIVNVRSNQLVYIEGGAIVRGSFIADKGSNIKIMGRGILDNSKYIKYENRPIEIKRCHNVTIQDIIITEAKNWCSASFASSDIKYQNLKIVSDYDTDDGIDIVGCQNVLVDGCFIKTKDDCIAIKAGVNYFTDFNSGFNVNDIVIQNCVLWNGMWGNALEIGFETRTDTIQNVTFKNCDIIHVEGPEGTFTIHNGDRAVIKNILYEDIRVEDVTGWLIDFRILESRYSKDKQRGKIEDIYFKNIYVEGETYPYSQILGMNPTNNIKNVTLDDFYIHGVKINSIYNGMIAIINLDNLVFK